jgi:hypothetical protein
MMTGVGRGPEVVVGLAGTGVPLGSASSRGVAVAAGAGAAVLQATRQTAPASKASFGFMRGRL